VAPASPAVGLGVAAHGTFGSLQVTDDLDGLLRGTVFDAGSYEVSGFELYGMGCPGTASKVPALNFGGDMAPSSSFSVELADGLGSAPAFIAIGLARTSVPFGSCTLLNSAQIVLGGLMTNAQGQISLPFSIPASAPVTGTPLHFQWAVADVNGGAFGLALSNGGSAKL
jgi:hypothetical protein